MKKFGILVLMAVMVVGVGAVVYGDSSSGSTLPQTASHTLTPTVDIAYKIEVTSSPTVTVSPLDTEDQSATSPGLLKVYWNVAGKKVEVAATDKPAWLTLKVGVDACSCGTSTYTGGTLLTLTTDYVSFITSGTVGSDDNMALTYKARMTTWDEAAEAKSAVTISYRIADSA